MDETKKERHLVENQDSMKITTEENVRVHQTTPGNHYFASSYSVRGCGHDTCQDYSCIMDGEIISGCAISDGHSSSSMSGYGSQFACESFCELIEQINEMNFTESDLKREIDNGNFCALFLKHWQEKVQLHMTKKQNEGSLEGSSLNINDYGATFIGALWCDKILVFIILGDGGIVIKEKKNAPEMVMKIGPGDIVYQSLSYLQPQLIKTNYYDTEKIESFLIMSDGLAIFNGQHEILLQQLSNNYSKLSQLEFENELMSFMVNEARPNASDDISLGFVCFLNEEEINAD